MSYESYYIARLSLIIIFPLWTDHLIVFSNLEFLKSIELKKPIHIEISELKLVLVSEPGKRYFHSHGYFRPPPFPSEKNYLNIWGVLPPFFWGGGMTT